MYVPPYEGLLRRLEISRASVEAGETIPIPGSLLKMLLQLAVTCGDFDEEGYLEANPDVRAAVERGDIESGHMHYIGFGYFEGRSGGMAEVDEGWYLRTYRDVAIALDEGRIHSASEHFLLCGGGEGRSPSAAQRANAAQWKSCLEKR